MNLSVRLFSWLYPTLLLAPLFGQESITPDFLVYQEDSPLQVISVAVTADRQDLLEGVTLANIGERPVARYTLGWLLVDKATGGKAGPFVGRTIDARIDPGGTHLVPAQGVGFREAFRLLRSKNFGASALIVGVVQVAFLDGAEWNYPLLQVGQFKERKDPVIEEKVRPILERQRRITESMTPQQQAANCERRDGAYWFSRSPVLSIWPVGFGYWRD